MFKLEIAPHPLLACEAFALELQSSVGTLPSLVNFADELASAPIVEQPRRDRVRALLRHGGYKPSGRGKPASEYLLAARSEGRFPRINPVVDACNLASVASGLPISLVDRNKLQGDLRIVVLPDPTEFVFNPAGQTIDASGLLALCDEIGPSGTPVKDAQRTKTDGDTSSVVAVVWGEVGEPSLAKVVAEHMRRLLAPYTK